MKSLPLTVILLSTCFVPSTLFAQYPPVEREETSKSKIKAITQITYFSCDVNAKSPVETQFRSEYDSRGNLTKRVGYGTAGNPLLQWTYSYDDKDNVVANSWDGGAVTVEYKYDTAGHPIKQTIFNADHTVKEQHVFTLNDKGKILEDAYADGRHTFKYDAAGNVSEWAEFKTDGSLVEKKKHTYNDKGDATETVVYDSGDRPSSKTVYLYDSTEHNTERDEYGADGKTLISRETFKRDPKGFVAEDSQFNSKGDCTQVTKMTYEFYP